MKHKHFNICLYQPQIPQNTGNIGRLCAATGNRLNLIAPFGFDSSDKNLRRAGLDYWPYLDVEVPSDSSHFFKRFGQKIAFLSKFGKKSYVDIPVDVECLVFGSETSGLPEDIHCDYGEQLYQIPMHHAEVRSLNLANSVAIVTYDMMRRRNLGGFEVSSST